MVFTVMCLGMSVVARSVLRWFCPALLAESAESQRKAKVIVSRDLGRNRGSERTTPETDLGTELGAEG